jgi:hypothetical protein
MPGGLHDPINILKYRVSSCGRISRLPFILTRVLAWITTRLVIMPLSSTVGPSVFVRGAMNFLIPDVTHAWLVIADEFITTYQTPCFILKPVPVEELVPFQ